MFIDSIIILAVFIILGSSFSAISLDIVIGIAIVAMFINNEYVGIIMVYNPMAFEDSIRVYIIFINKPSSLVDIPLNINMNVDVINLFLNTCIFNIMK